MNTKDLKWVSLCVLILQTTALVLVLRYSRTQNTTGPRYLSSTAIATAEVVKLFSCLLMITWQHGFKVADVTSEVYTECFSKSREALKMSVPALLYVIQNNLLFFALSKLDAATYQVTYQLKILTTAFFSVTLLRNKLSGLKWFSLIMLTMGVALVQIPKDESKTAAKTTSFFTVDYDRLIGLLAVMAACFSSGFAGVFFEKVLKGTLVSLWMRNVQLAFFSIFGAIFMVWLYDSEAVYRGGFFQGYNLMIWIVVMLQAYGGLVVAVVVKYADNILKGFAVSLSIILSSFMSYWLLNDFEPSLTFAIGASVVIFSTFLYGYEPRSVKYEVLQDSEHKNKS